MRQAGARRDHELVVLPKAGAGERLRQNGGVGARNWLIVRSSWRVDPVRNRSAEGEAPVCETDRRAAASPEDNMAKTTEPTIIKKYANRRLYNTGTSTYVTLEDLAQMVKGEEDFVVFDAKSGEEITRSVLTQIIFEQENKGQNLLPITFLRQLIRFYGDSMQNVVPSYLDFSMSSLTEGPTASTTALMKCWSRALSGAAPGMAHARVPHTPPISSRFQTTVFARSRRHDLQTAVTQVSRRCCSKCSMMDSSSSVLSTSKAPVPLRSSPPVI